MFLAEKIGKRVRSAQVGLVHVSRGFQLDGPDLAPRLDDEVDLGTVLRPIRCNAQITVGGCRPGGELGEDQLLEEQTDAIA